MADPFTPEIQPDCPVERPRVAQLESEPFSKQFGYGAFSGTGRTVDSNNPSHISA